MTFSEKGTRMTSQLHISKSWFFSIKSVKTKYFKTFSVQKSVSRHIGDKKSLFLWTLLEKLRISNFEMWSWDVIFVPFSEKVTCTLVNTCFKSNFYYQSYLFLSQKKSTVFLQFALKLVQFNKFIAINLKIP